MTSEKINNEGDETLGLLAVRLLSKVPMIVSSFVSLVTVAYMSGWIQARAYYSVFDADDHPPKN